jgi:D-mannonate dehydratase
VTAVEIDNVVVDSEIGNLTFDDQIEIKGVDRAFSQPGDSGSLIVSDQNQAMGILFCGNEFANGGLGVTYANPLPKVMDAFNLKPL